MVQDVLPVGVSLNISKHQRCSQSVDEPSFRFNKFSWCMLVLQDKQIALVEVAASLGVADVVPQYGR